MLAGLRPVGTTAPRSLGRAAQSCAMAIASALWLMAIFNLSVVSALGQVTPPLTLSATALHVAELSAPAQGCTRSLSADWAG